MVDSYHKTVNTLPSSDFTSFVPTGNYNFQIQLGLGNTSITLEQLRSQYDDYERANLFYNFQSMIQGQLNLTVTLPQPLSSVNCDDTDQQHEGLDRKPNGASVITKTRNTYDQAGSIFSATLNNEHKKATKRNQDKSSLGSRTVEVNASTSEKRKLSDQEMQQQQLRKMQKQQENDAKWLASYEELKQFQKLTGHTAVPRGYAHNTKLASWVSKQRKEYQLFINNHKSSIPRHRIQLLSDIDFVWNAQTSAWDRQLAQLQNFHAENGHCNVPIHHKKYIKLNLWVCKQRRQYALLQKGKESSMNQERIQRLCALDFCFSTHEERWQQRLCELKKFKVDNGHYNVTSSNSPKGLSDWVQYQRGQYKNMMLGKSSYLTSQRVEELNKISFIWSLNEMCTTGDICESQSGTESHNVCRSMDSFDSDVSGTEVAKARESSSSRLNHKKDCV